MKSFSPFVNKHPYFSAIIIPMAVTFFVCAASYGVQTDLFQGSFHQYNYTGYLAAMFAMEVFSAYLAYWLLKRANLPSRLLLRSRRTGKGLLLGWTAMAYALYAAWSISAGNLPEDFVSPKLGMLALAVLVPLSVGLGEELLFRGFALQALLARLGSTKKGIWIACLLSSLIFGLSHAFKLFFDGHVPSTIPQVISTAMMGMLFCALYLRTGTLWPSILLHGLIDLPFFMIYAVFTNRGIFLYGLRYQLQFELYPWLGVASILLVLPLFIAGLWMMRKVDPLPLSFLNNKNHNEEPDAATPKDMFW